MIATEDQFLINLENLHKIDKMSLLRQEYLIISCGALIK